MKRIWNGLGTIGTMVVLVTFALTGVAIIDGCSTTAVATPEEQVISATLAEQLDAAEVAGDQAEVDRISALIAQHDTNIAERAVGGFIDAIDPWVPVPLQPFKEVLAGVGALALFKRPRKHLITGLKSLVKLDVKDAGASALKSIGLFHSSGESLAVLRVAATNARKEGRDARANEIDALIASLEASPASPTANVVTTS